MRRQNHGFALLSSRFQQRQQRHNVHLSSGVYQDAIKLIKDVKLAVNVVCRARTAAVVHRGGGARAGLATRDGVIILVYSIAPPPAARS